jgi:DNA-binding response OmpR family regulator
LSETESRSLRLLVVTDDPALLDALEYGLPADREAEFVHDARVALERLNESIPSVVIVDLQTGSAGGYGLARDMAADPRLAQIPVVMLLERPQDAWLAEHAGARLHLVKPVNVDDLLDRAGSLISPV